MKKILMFIPRMGSGGAERVMATLSNELSRENYEILILTLTSDESFYELEKEIKIKSGNYKISKDNSIKRVIDIFFKGWKSLFFLNKTIKDYNPDVVISFLIHTNILALITKVLNSQVQLIISERSDPWKRKKVIQIITKYFYPLADSIVCQSDKVKDFFPEYSHSKIDILQNPIDEANLPIKHVGKRRKVISAIGRLAEEKNFSLLINSFNDVLQEYPEYHLEIYGGGPLEKILQNQIKNLNLLHKISLMGIKKDVLECIKDTELFVMTSNHEGFPNALIEAMAIGLPVISTDFPTGVAEELVKSENGLIVPVGDQLALSSAMKKILSMKDKRENMGKKNMKIKKTLKKELIITEWIELIEKKSLKD